MWALLCGSRLIDKSLCVEVETGGDIQGAIDRFLDAH